jgi:hypothetical protein
MLLLEFGTHPYDIPALVQLCHLVCDFFAPLLSSNGEALAANLLQFRYNKLLTQRLHDFDGDKKSKVKEFSVFLLLELTGVALFHTGHSAEGFEDPGAAELQAHVRRS